MSCTAWGLSCLLPCGWSGGLLPRLFTLAPLRFQIGDLRFQKGGLLFCDTFRCPGFRQRPPRLAPGMLPCGVRTFLSSAELASPTSDHSDRPVASIGRSARISKFNFPHHRLRQQLHGSVSQRSRLKIGLPLSLAKPSRGREKAGRVRQSSVGTCEAGSSAAHSPRSFVIPGRENLCQSRVLWLPQCRPSFQRNLIAAAAPCHGAASLKSVP